ncbi:MAG: hypothetical protein ACON5K_04030 [Bacteroidia bacterium]
MQITKNMKIKHLTIFLLTLITLPICGQYYNRSSYAANKSVRLYSARYNSSLDSMDGFVKNTGVVLIKKNMDLNSSTYQFEMPDNLVSTLDKSLNNWGYIFSSNIETNNLQKTIKNYEEEIDKQKRIIENNQEDLNRLRMDTSDPKPGSGNRVYSENNYITTIRNAENRIEDIKKSIDETKKLGNTIYVTVEIYDDVATPDGRKQKVSWVNMPGVSYSFLQVENPKLGISHEQYAGFNLKYMFTRGKSYIEIGVLKPLSILTSIEQQDPTLSNTKNDFFLIQFGQDFYSRHFGRGKRKFLNLYSGYTIGVMLPNQYNDIKQKSVPVGSLSIGVELLKTKHVLLDTRAAYFLPINDENRNTRGLLYNASLNFVF